MDDSYKKIILLGTLLILLLSCCKEKCTEYTLGVYKNYNPLNGYEKIIYDNSGGAEIVLNGTGRYNSFALLSEDPCREVEFNWCNLESVNSNFKFVIHMRAKWEHQDASLTIYMKEYNYTTSANEYFGYKTVFILPLSKENLQPGQFYYDSLYIFDRYYMDIYSGKIVNDLEKSINDTIYPSTLYYNINYGILKVDFDDGSSWELKEIIN